MKAPAFIGHREVFHSLEGWRASGRLPHALIFLGPDGIGKQLVAHHLAASLLCESKNAPCGDCRSCHLIQEGKHPDLWNLEPDNGRIKIDQIREVKKAMAMPPLVSQVRVVLLTEAHALNPAAANALLKTLEEPPPETYFLLVSHAAGWVPKTILSRCQKIRFSPLSQEELSQVLGKLGKTVDSRILRLAQGSVRWALLLGEAQADLPSLESLWEGAETLGMDEAYALGQSIQESERLLPLLEGLLLESHQYLTQGPSLPARSFEVLTFAERILEFRRELRQNANPKLHLPRLLMFFKEPLESRL